MQIKRHTSQDIPKVLQLIRTVYNDNIYEKALKRFRWQYEENPSNTSEGPIILVIEEKEEIVGMIGFFAQRVKIGACIYPGYWAGDFMVHPNFRAMRFGMDLAKKGAGLPHLIMGFPAEETLKLWFRTGAMQFCQLAEYTKKSSFWHDRIKDLFSYRVPKEIEIKEIHRFDERFDRLWDKASQHYKNIQVRDSKFLNWRFFECPHLKYRVLAALKNSEIEGYVVVRDERKTDHHEGAIVDLFCSRSNTSISKALIHAGIKSLQLTGSDLINIRISSYDNVLKDILHEFSFTLLKEWAGTYSYSCNNNLGPAIKKQSDWFLTKADSDVDFS